MEQVGLVCLNIDHNVETDFRVVLQHISAKNVDLFEKTLHEILKYAWHTI